MIKIIAHVVTGPLYTEVFVYLLHSLFFILTSPFKGITYSVCLISQSCLWLWKGSWTWSHRTKVASVMLECRKFLELFYVHHLPAKNHKLHHIHLFLISIHLSFFLETAPLVFSWVDVHAVQIHFSSVLIN